MSNDRDHLPGLPASPGEVSRAVSERPSNPWAAPPEGEPQDGWDTLVKRYLSALWRHKWAVIGVVALGTGIGALASRFVKLEYVAQATLWMETARRNDNSQGPIQQGGLLESTAWIDLMRSFTVLDHVVREERLYLSHEPADREFFSDFRLASEFRPGEYVINVDDSGRGYQLATEEGELIERGTFGGPIGDSIGFEWAPSAGSVAPGRRIKFRVVMPRDAARELNGRLGAHLPRDGNFLRVWLQGRDPQQIASVVNTVTDRYVEVAVDLKRRQLDEVANILAEQLAYAQRNLAEAETALEGFRVQTITLPGDRATPVTPGLEFTRDPVFNNFFDLKVRREQLQREREAISSALRGDEESSISIDALAIIPSIQKSPEASKALTELTTKNAELRALRREYTDEHEAVRQARAAIEQLEKTALPALGRAVQTNLDSQLAVIDGLIGSVSSELQEIPPRAIEEARLRRGVTVAENLYNNLRHRYENARLAAESSVPDISVLDAAVVPQRPVQDGRRRFILMWFFGSLGLAFGGVLLVDRFDPRLRYPSDVSDRLGLTILGAVPRVRNGGGLRGREDANMALEALRGIRLSVMHAYGSAGPLMATVTSPGPGDGKSFISSNLALAFADLGHRTLLVDADTRRGELHRVMGGRRRPGLTDYLTGSVSLEEIVQQTSDPDVQFIGSGTRFRNSPELLASPAAGELLSRLRPRYRVILVDSPPLAAGVDSLILGSLTGSMLMVLRSGRTARTLAEAQMDALHRLPIRMLGAVMNGTGQEGMYRYYYSYLPGYEATGETGEVAALVMPGKEEEEEAPARG